MMTKSKTAGNYPNSCLAKQEALRCGYEEAIMLDPHGLVSECTGENIFAVRDGILHTPHRTTVLEGMTRDSLIKIAKDLKIEVREEPMTRDQLYIADEVFLCGTAAELTPVREIDGRPVGTGKPGPITKKLQDIYFKAVHGKVARYKKWNEFI